MKSNVRTSHMFNRLLLSPPNKNLYRLFLLRSIAIILQCPLFFLVYSFIEQDIPWAELIAVVVGLAIINIMTWYRLHQNWPVTNLEFFTASGRCIGTYCALVFQRRIDQSFHLVLLASTDYRCNDLTLALYLVNRRNFHRLLYHFIV